MSDDLSIKGSLAETTIPALFRSLMRGHETAVVTAERDGVRSEVYFREGRIVYASTSDRDLRLGETLLRNGLLDIRQFQQASEHERPGKRIGAVLCELGFISPEQLVRSVELQVKEILADGFNWAHGEYTLDFREELPKDVVTLNLDSDRIVLDAIAGVMRWSQIQRGLGPLDTAVTQTPGQDTRLYKLDLTPEEAHVYESVELRYPISQVCAMSYLPDYAVCKIVWGLLTVNLLEESTVADVPGAVDGHELELRLEEMVESYNRAFVGIFEIVSGRIGEEVYDFADALFRDLPDDVRASFRDINLRDSGRVDFEQLYHNLVQSHDPNLEAQVQNILNELLYGWVLRVRMQFGTALEADVTRAINAIRE